MPTLIESLKLDAAGLIPAIAQDAVTGEVLMVAWMNAESLQRTLDTGEATYWSRSRGKLWHKGEESGNVQKIDAVFLDCDNDTILLKVQQIGDAACHTGYRSCGTLHRSFQQSQSNQLLQLQ